jgi:aryl-alcohol dehydrogenase-like predicted oxidoreductase
MAASPSASSPDTSEGVGGGGVRRRPLGRTGITVSEVGFGAWGIGGRTAGATSYGDTDDVTSLAALEAAFGLGITLIDTAPPYGDGRSERLVGQAAAGRRDRIVLSTKAGVAAFDRPADFSPGAVRRSLEGSLERLGTGYVDLLELHSPPLDLLLERPEILAGLDALRAEGLARAVGVSVKAPQDGLRLMAAWRPDALQVNLNMLDLRAVECGLLERAADLGVGIIARTPLAFGFLSGRIPEDAAFPPGDHRAAWPEEQRRRWIEGVRRLRAAVPPGEGETPAQVALRWCLSWPAVASVIPGILTPAEAVENAAAAARGALSAAALERVAAVHRDYDPFAPVKPR